MNHAVIAGLQGALLFGVRQQQVLGQAPVEEHTDAVDFNHLQAGELPDLHLGFFSGGEQLVFAVQIDEHIEPVFIFRRNVLGDVPIGQKDFTILRTVQIQTEVRVLDDLQAVVAPD